jgi:hypothetical protein
VIGVSAVSASTPAKNAKSEPAPRIFPCASRPCATAWIGEGLSQLRAPGIGGGVVMTAVPTGAGSVPRATLGPSAQAPSARVARIATAQRNGKVAFARI